MSSATALQPRQQTARSRLQALGGFLIEDALQELSRLARLSTLDENARQLEFRDVSP